MGESSLEMWNLIFDQCFEDFTKPIEPIVLPQEFSSYLVKCDFIAEEVPKNWRLGGYLDHLIEDPPNQLNFFKSYAIYLGEPRLCSFEPLADKFRIRFRPLKRYFWFTLKVWIFQG